MAMYDISDEQAFRCIRDFYEQGSVIDFDPNVLPSREVIALETAQSLGVKTPNKLSYGEYAGLLDLRRGFYTEKFLSKQPLPAVEAGRIAVYNELQQVYKAYENRIAGEEVPEDNPVLRYFYGIVDRHVRARQATGK